jgi:hypothetical protein
VASYVSLLEPREDLQGRMKYSVSMIFPKDTTDIEKLEEAVAEAAHEKFGKKLPKNFRSPIRDGDEEREDREEYQNSWFMNASTTRRPGIVDYKSGDIVDSDDEDVGIYSGCTCRASIAFFGYDQQGNKGVGVGLNNVQVLKRGSRLDGTRSAESDFGDAEDVDLAAL